MYESELALVKAVVPHLRGAGVECFEEVPCMSRSIDLLIVRAGCLVAVEFKLRDWKRAIAQAKDHLLSVDSAYVCMPERSVTPEMEALFTAEGVGLLFPRLQGPWPFVDVLPAPASVAKWSVAENWLREHLAVRRSGRWPEPDRALTVSQEE